MDLIQCYWIQIQSQIHLSIANPFYQITISLAFIICVKYSVLCHL